MSAFGGEADVNHCVGECPLIAISGHSGELPANKRRPADAKGHQAAPSGGFFWRGRAPFRRPTALPSSPGWSDTPPAGRGGVPVWSNGAVSYTDYFHPSLSLSVTDRAVFLVFPDTEAHRLFCPSRIFTSLWYQVGYQ